MKKEKTDSIEEHAEEASQIIREVINNWHRNKSDIFVCGLMAAMAQLVARTYRGVEELPAGVNHGVITFYDLIVSSAQYLIDSISSAKAKAIEDSKGKQ